ncbi:MAG: hypothetical protein Q7R95_08585 [bacterium]|nr:hypothetical protein [bacterium]
MPSESFNTSENIGKGGESLVIDKKQGLQQLIELFRVRIEKLTSSSDDTRESAREAVGANKSHSDTSKFQLSNVKLGIDSVRIETEETISLLLQTPLNDCSKIVLGAVFTINEIGGKSKERNYFLVSAGGGETLTLGGMDIISITPGAPIARACLQKNKGETFEFQGKKFEITDIK